MIAKLRGIVDFFGDDSAIIDVNGVGYLVYASNRTLSKLVKGSETTLFIETVVREDSISLYGFTSALEKEWFLTLTKVQGVGAKVCLSILSILTPQQLSQAIAAQDKTSFTRAAGVGPKLAPNSKAKWSDFLSEPIFLIMQRLWTMKIRQQLQQKTARLQTPLKMQFRLWSTLVISGLMLIKP